MQWTARSGSTSQDGDRLHVLATTRLGKSELKNSCFAKTA
jgi:hypothetical protein